MKRLALVLAAAALAIVRKLGLVKTGERMDDVDGLEFVFERQL